ncbi:hypothetical protein ACFYM5_38845 [Streptomyces sp. NPDC006706]|uniref:hypothetical protein n=1 Tax=Streptomyces sp. NPDC006706 TaxID=3364761 RepID=UPI00367D4268
MLMLSDHSLDRIEDAGGDINQSVGVINLASHDWFAVFDPEQARDPARGFCHP